MKSGSRDRLNILAAILLMLLLSLIGLITIPFRVVKVPFGTATKRFTVHNFVNPHSEPEKCLTIFSEKFCQIRGNIPFYIAVSNSSSIFFVTANKNDIKWHFYELSLKNHRVVDASQTTLVGFSIGERNQNERVYFDGSGRVAVEVDQFSYQRNRPATTRYIVDLEKQLILGGEILYYRSYSDHTIMETERLTLRQGASHLLEPGLPLH